MNIKKHIVKALGGTMLPTKEEKDAEYWKGYYEGQNDALVDLIMKMDSLYGDDKWGDQVYSYAKKQYQYWKERVNNLGRKEGSYAETTM